MNFGGSSLTSAGGSDIFVAKFDAAGNHVWSKRFGGASDQYAERVAVDGSGNVFVTGYFFGTVDFGGGVLTNAGPFGWDAFLARFDAAGNHLWSKRFGDDADTHQIATSVVADGSGNVIVTGEFSGTVDFGGGGLTNTGWGDNVFLVKYDAAGNHLWSKHFGDDDIQTGQDVTVDASGNSDNVIVTGYFDGTLDFSGNAMTSAGSYDIFVAKFDAAGNHLWSRRFGDANEQHGDNTAADGSGNVIVTGDYFGTVDFGGEPLTEVGDGDMFIVKFDATGNHLWSKSFGNGTFQNFSGVTTDRSNNVITAGAFWGTLDFGGGSLTSAGLNDIFVAKFDAVGEHVWSRRYGDSGFQRAEDVAVDAWENVTVTGELSGMVDFGHGVLSGAGMFLSKFWPGNVTGVPGDEIPKATYLMQNVPNPFSPGTRIAFRLREAGGVSLRIYDASGRLVRVLADGPRGSGPDDVVWNGEDDLQRRVASGVYFCRLVVAGETHTRKLVLVR